MEGNPIIDCVLMRLSVEFRSGNRKKVYLSARSLTDISQQQLTYMMAPKTQVERTSGNK